MDLIHDARDGFAVGAAHDIVAGSANDQDRFADLLPGFTKIQGLQLLIKSGGAPVLAVGRIVPESLPFGMLGDDLRGSHSLHQIQRVELDERFDAHVHLGGRFSCFHQAATLQI